MENILVMLDEDTEKMVERIAKKVNLKFNSNVIDIDSIFNLLSDLEDLYDDTVCERDKLQEDFDDYKQEVADNYQPKSSYTYDEDLGAFRGE